MQNACRFFQESVNFVKGVNNCFIKACNFEWVFHLKNTVKFDCQFKDGYGCFFQELLANWFLEICLHAFFLYVLSVLTFAQNDYFYNIYKYELTSQFTIRKFKFINYKAPSTNDVYYGKYGQPHTDMIVALISFYYNSNFYGNKL